MKSIKVPDPLIVELWGHSQGDLELFFDMRPSSSKVSIRFLYLLVDFILTDT